MKSKGKNQEYKCVKCGKSSKSKTLLEIPRRIQEKLYIPEVSAHRHLTRPQIRVGKINKISEFDDSSLWFSVYNSNSGE